MRPTPLALSAALLLAAVSSATAGKTKLLSKGAHNQGPNLFFGRSVISANERFIAFAGNAPGVVPDDIDLNTDVFLYDRKKKKRSRLSVPSDGGSAGGNSYHPSISADGRYIAYISSAINLPLASLNPGPDIYVHDRKLGTNELISVKWIDIGGIPLPIGANGSCFNPSISADGRYVTFASFADNLANGASSNHTNVYLHDRESNTTQLASANNLLQAANESCTYPALAADMSRLAFVSKATNLGPPSDPDHKQVLLRDLGTGELTLGSVAMDGGAANGDCKAPVLSADGRYVAFTTNAWNLVESDLNGAEEVFVRDLKKGVTHRITLDWKGNEVAAGSFGAAISANGRYVTFMTQAALVKSDQNGDFDVYLHDIKKGKTTRISKGHKGKTPNGGSFDAAIGGKGRFIAFRSCASNLVKGDENDIDDVFLHDRNK